MKKRHALGAAMALAFSLAAGPAAAEWVQRVTVVDTVVPGDSIVILEARPGSPIHAGAMTYEDDLLVQSVASALESRASLARPGITATVSAKDGRVSMSGTADNFEQAQRAERAAKAAAGPYHFSGTLSTTSG